MRARAKKEKSGIGGGPEESLRWVEGYERIADMAAHLPQTRLVYVADREADLMRWMLWAQDLGLPADWLVRALRNRCLPDGQKPWQHTHAGVAVGEIARETDAPAGVKPIEWHLLTTREANTLADAVELIDWYRARREIEILFNVLKKCLQGRSTSIRFD